MRRTLLFGVAAAVLYAVVTVVGLSFGASFTNVAVGNVLVGIAGGAAVGLVRVGSPTARAGAFLVGYFVCVVFYLVRVGFLPTNWAGMVVFGSGCLLLVTVVSALTRGRLPLFAMFVGVVVFSGTMEAPAINTSWYLLSQLPQIATGLLVPVSAGFLVTLLVEWREGSVADEPAVPVPSAVAPGGPVGASVPAPAGPAGPGDAGLQVLDGSSGGSQS